MGAMTLSATREWDFSSEQGKANYKAAQRRYPAQAIVDLAALRDNMRHLVSVVGGPHSGTAVMGIVKADAYGHGLIPAALAALAGGATGSGFVSSCREFSRSLVSASVQVGKQIEGGGVWRALAGSGASLGGFTVLGDVFGKLALQPVASHISASAASSNSSKGGLCIGVDFGDLVTVGSFQGAVAFRCVERSPRGGRALGLQRGHGVGGFQLGFGQPQGLHQQGKAQAQRGGDGGVLPGIGAQGGQHVSSVPG